MSRFGHPETDPVRFLVVRAAVMFVAAVVLVAVVFGDPLWFALAYAAPVAAVFALASYYLRRTMG